jgi:hypothetical protein
MRCGVTAPLYAWRDLYQAYWRVATGRSLVALLRSAWADGWLPSEILERDE